ncbi:hypothetical protein C8Q79DRAFT_919928 [Trametes meyenii]|nr:hypothetical protein C8Q79DRAFT_919928 [Trametes meyenii]
MRPIVSYDDIVAPEPAPAPQKQLMNPPPSAPPPAKKRKTNPVTQRHGSSSNGRGHQPVQHWDDPGAQEPQMSYDEGSAVAASTSAGGSGGRGGEYYEEEEEEEESRELSHEEIWDDSALIDAWNSAAAEYEAFHGPGKNWKDEPVKKSPLWYNVPPAVTPKPKAGPSGTPSTQNSASTYAAINGVAADFDSTPLNFDTYVPTHDPSLAIAGSAPVGPATGGAEALGAGADMAMVSQDEAFSRAMTAMYWSGYWTAVYHSRRNEAQQSGTVEHSNDEKQEDGIEEEAGEEDMLPAQR